MANEFSVPLLGEEEEKKESFSVPLLNQTTDLEKPQKEKFNVPLLEEQDGSYIGAFKPTGTKLFDAVVMAGEQGANLPGRIARSAKNAAIQDITDDINDSIDQSDRSLLDNILLRGGGLKYRYEKQTLENELGLSDKGNLGILWETVFGESTTSILKKKVKYKEMSLDERSNAREELRKESKEHASETKKINDAYNLKKQKLWDKRGYTEEEIALVGGVSSMAVSLSSMGAAVFTRNPRVAYATLPYFGLVTQQETYESSIASGMSDKDARYNSYIQGGTEIASEMFTQFTVVRSLNKFLKKQKQNVKSLVLEGGGILAAESVGEQFNGLAQSITQAYYDNTDELRIAWDNKDNPLYEGTDYKDILWERARLTSIASLAAGGGMVTANGAIKYNASKDWIKNSSKPQETQESVKNVILSKELDKVALEQASIKALEEENLNDANTDPMEILAEEILKIELPGKKSEVISETTNESVGDPLNDVANIDDGLLNVEKFLKAKGYDIDKMNLTTGTDYAAELRNEPPNQIRLLDSIGFRVDFNNVKETANKIDQFIIKQNAEKKFKIKVKPTPKEKIVLPKKPKPITARSFYLGSMSNNALKQEEIVRALSGGGDKVSPVYRAKKGGGEDSLDAGGAQLLEEGFFRGRGEGGTIKTSGETSRLDVNEIADLLEENPLTPKSQEELNAYESEMEGIIYNFISKNPGSSVSDIAKAAGRTSKINIEDALIRLEDADGIEKSTLSGDYTYKIKGQEEQVKTDPAEIDFTEQVVPDSSQPVTLEDFENIPSFPADDYFNEQDKIPVYPEFEEYTPKNTPLKPARSGSKSDLDKGSNITDSPKEEEVDPWGVGQVSYLEEKKQELEFKFQNTVGYIKDVEKAYDKRAEEKGLPKLTISEKPSEAFVRLPGLRATKQQKSLEAAETIVEKMQEKNIKADDVDIVARALHAPERNRKVYKDKLNNIDELIKEAGETPTKNQAAQIEKAKKDAARFEDNGSGIRTEEAIDALKDYGIEHNGTEAIALNEEGQVLLDLTNEYHQYIKETVDLYNEGGLIDDSTSEDFKSGENYKYYVPLTGWAADTTIDNKPNRKGKGLSIKDGEFIKAEGRKSISASPFIQMVDQRMKAIDRATKNDVLNRIGKLFTEEFDGSDIAEVVDIKPKEMEMVFGFKEGGSQKWLKVYNEKLARSLNAYDSQTLDKFSRTMRPITRFMSAMYTAFSPPFVLKNFMRDLVGGGIGIYTEQNLPGGRAEGKAILESSVKNVLPRLRQFYQGIKGKQIEEDGIQEAYERFNEYGANSGFVTTLGQEKIGDFYNSLKKKYKGTASLESEDKLLLRVGGGFKGAYKATEKWMYDLNSAVENGIRFSTFVEFIKAENGGKIQGAKKETLEQAASLAKQLTIDYTTKGDVGNVINSHFIFFNAAVQSNVPLYRALAKNKKIALQVGGGISTYATMLTLYNFLVSEEDETGRPIYENIAERYGNRYVITMIPGVKINSDDELPKLSFGGGPIKVNGKTVAFAYPQTLGFNVPFNLARNAVETQAHKIFKLNRQSKTIGQASLDMFDTFSTGVMPLGVNVSKKGDLEGFASTVIRAATPSYAKPLTEIAVNENFFNIPITKQFYGGSKGIPESSVVTSYDKDVYIWLAQFVNEMTGGNNEMLEKGFVDLQPGQIKYIAEYYGGGPMAFGNKTAEGIRRFMYSEIQDVKDINFVNTFLVQEQDGVYSRRFYSAMDDIESKTYKYDKIEDPEAKAEFYRKNKNVIKLNYLSDMDKQIKKSLPSELKVIVEKPLTDIRRRMDKIKDADKTLQALKLREKDPSSYYLKIDKIKEDKRRVHIDLLKQYEKAMAKDEKQD